MVDLDADLGAKLVSDVLQRRVASTADCEAQDSAPLEPHGLTMCTISLSQSEDRMQAHKRAVAFARWHCLELKASDLWGLNRPE